MIQFLLILLGISLPNNNMYNNSQTCMTISNSKDLGDALDTGGETQPIPPKK